MGTYNVEPHSEAQVREWFAAHLAEFEYSIIKSGSAFPDLILDDGQGKRLLVEVERNSDSFLRHRHDPNGCDLVLCWWHTMNVGVPVLELATRRMYTATEQIAGIPDTAETTVLAKPFAAYIEKCKPERAAFLGAWADDLRVQSEFTRSLAKPRMALFAAQHDLECAIVRAGGQRAVDAIGNIHPYAFAQLL